MLSDAAGCFPAITFAVYIAHNRLLVVTMQDVLVYWSLAVYTLLVTRLTRIKLQVVSYDHIIECQSDYIILLHVS